MKYLLLFLIALVPAASFAEDRAGFIGGVTFARLRGVDDTDWQSFFIPGVYADLGLTEDFYITPQLRYMRKGLSYSDRQTSGLFDLNIALKYIELPVYFKYKFPNGNNFRPNLFIGPAFGVKVGNSITVTDRLTGQKITRRGLDDSGLRDFDVAMEAGAGLEFMLSEAMIGSFNVAYSHGLIDIDKDIQKIRTQAIHIYAGIGF